MPRTRGKPFSTKINYNNFFTKYQAFKSYILHFFSCKLEKNYATCRKLEKQKDCLPVYIVVLGFLLFVLCCFQFVHVILVSSFFHTKVVKVFANLTNFSNIMIQNFFYLFAFVRKTSLFYNLGH